MTPWIPSPPETPEGTPGVGQPAREWLCTLHGTSPDGAVSHVTKIYATGEDPYAYSHATMCRILSLFVIADLNDSAIVEACESLTDIYTSQAESAHPQDLLIMQARPVSTATPKQLGKIW